MRCLHHYLAVTAAVVALAGTARAQQSPPQATPVMNTATPADKALAGSMDKMSAGMAKPMSGNADQDFTMMMLAHHQGAVAMAKVELRYGKDPFLRQLSRQIIASQSTEIRQMQAWQARHPLAAK